MLARAGAPVTMIGRPAFVEAVNKNGLYLDTMQFQERVFVRASTELSAAAGADVVLFCVKATDNASTARELAAPLSPGAIVVSMQNGVDNVEQIRAAANIEALPCVVYVAASVPEPGKIKHSGRGDLAVGPAIRKNRAAWGNFYARGSSLPHHRQHCGRIVDQTGVELHAERDFGAGTGAVRANCSQ